MANDSVRENTGPSASASHTQAAAVAAHPERDMFLSGENVASEVAFTGLALPVVHPSTPVGPMCISAGSSSDHVFLWKHGETSSRATYLPALESTAHHSHTSRQLLPDLVLVRVWDEASGRGMGPGRQDQDTRETSSLGSIHSLDLDLDLDLAPWPCCCFQVVLVLCST